MSGKAGEAWLGLYVFCMHTVSGLAHTCLHEQADLVAAVGVRQSRSDSRYAG